MKKKRIILIILLILIIVGTLGGWMWKTKRSQQNNQSSTSTPTSTVNNQPTATPEPSPTATPASGLSQAEVDTLKSDAKTFYEAAYNQDYDTVVTMMTDTFAGSFNGLKNNNDPGSNDYGADAVLNLKNYTNVAEPESINDPEEIAQNAEYVVSLKLKNDYVARVGFQKDNEGQFKVFSFNTQSASKGNGGVAGAGR